MPDPEVPIHAEVSSRDGSYGRSVCVIFDPVRGKVTHLVVREAEPPQIQRLVPIDLVEVVTPRNIRIASTRSQLNSMRTFKEADFILADARLPWVMMWPLVVTPPELIVLEHEKLPADQAALRRGAPVYASDGFIGDVGELMIDQTGGKITHIVLKDGHLWGKKDISIPVSMIRTMGPAGIQLRLTKDEIKALPVISVCRSHV